MYSLSLKLLNSAEMVHHADDELLVYSYFNCVIVKTEQYKKMFVLPLPAFLRIIGIFRLIRRPLRLDKCSIALSEDRKNMVITYRGAVYHCCLERGTIQKTFDLTQCATVLHQGIASLDANVFVFGEYGRNSTRQDVPLYLSIDGGRNWRVQYTFPAGSIRHIHGAYYDKFTGHIWVPTGDFAGECYIYEFDDINLDNPTIHGDGSQVWRTVGLFFTEDSVVWGMDSELEVSHLVTMNRCSGKIAKGRSFPGPVWYIKSLVDGLYLLQTTVENGEGVNTDSVHVFASRDLKDWDEVASFRHDGMPLRFFKNAVLAFSNGVQNSNSFYISAEAVQGMDGKAFKCRISGEKGGWDV